MAANDSVAIAGSEDGWIYAWDVLSGDLVSRLEHNPTQGEARNSRKIVSAVAYNERTHELASAGGEGMV